MIENIGKHYIYRHIRLDKNQPFYVGIGTKPENCCLDNACYKRAFNKVSRSKFWKGVVSKTDYEVEILLESDDYEFIKQKEIEFIALYGRRDLGKGTLVNMTDGGEGLKGRIVSDEWRKNHSESMKGKPGRKGELNHNYGKPLSEEVLLKISNSLKGRVFSEEHLKKMSEVRKGKPMPFETRYGADAANAIKVIDILTFEVFGCKKEAAEKNNINYNSITGLLKGVNPNYTNLRHLDDFNDNISILKNKLLEKYNFEYDIDIQNLRHLYAEDYISFWKYYPGNKPIKREKFTEDVVQELVKKYKSISELRSKNILLYRLIQNKFSHLIDHLRNDIN